MKTTWLVAAILAMGVGFHQIKGAHAQVHGGANHGKSIHDNPDHAAKLVNATPEQTKKLKVLHQQVMAKTNAIKARKDLTDAQRKVQFELLHKDAFGQLQKILSPEQMKKLMAHTGMKGPGFSPMAILEKLDLSEQQKARIHQIMSETEQAILAVKNDASLTPVQKEIKAKQLHEQALRDMHGILTPEQSRKAHEIMKQHHEKGGNHNPPPAQR